MNSSLTPTGTSSGYPRAVPAGSRKATLRARALDVRARRSTAERAAAADALARHLSAAPFCRAGRVVGAYVPVATEPGSIAMLDVLHAAGVEVLLPAVLDPEDPDRALGWTVYSGPDALAPGPWGLLEPVGIRRGLVALATASAVLVPALLVDGAGRRLGRGGGYYDRVLAELPPAVRRVAVVYDDEFLATDTTDAADADADTDSGGVPTEPHDRPVDGVLTPTGGLRWLG